MTTFDELGYSFPLFCGPVEHAAVEPSGHCVNCGEHRQIRFNEMCYSCFRQGRSDHAVDTEFGFVDAAHAAEGRTHGIPLNNPSQFADHDLVPHSVDPNFPDQRWYGFRFEPKFLSELLRTPKYHTWQGEQWLFCCKRPMIFQGSLPSRIFRDADFDWISEIAKFLASPNWDRTISRDYGSHTLYVFRCGQCETIRYHDDMD